MDPQYEKLLTDALTAAVAKRYGKLEQQWQAEGKTVARTIAFEADPKGEHTGTVTYTVTGKVTTTQQARFGYKTPLGQRERRWLMEQDWND